MMRRGSSRRPPPPAVDGDVNGDFRGLLVLDWDRAARVLGAPEVAIVVSNIMARNLTSSQKLSQKLRAFQMITIVVDPFRNCQKNFAILQWRQSD
jgi:hypothetical protein